MGNNDMDSREDYSLLPRNSLGKEYEAIEMCPHCGCECSFPNYSVKKNGYVAKCTGCGREILLCDECRHSADNPGMFCDWHMISLRNGIVINGCFRGVTHDKADGYDIANWEWMQHERLLG